MIDPKDIYCTSSLYDSCGIVFEYEGRVFRALYERGAKIFELLSREGWMERLVDKGLVHMKRTDLHLPGYHSIIELEDLRPIIPPFMWTTNMLREAALALCKLSQEALTRDLLLWDLKGMSNMTFCAKRGPVFLDLGAFHTTGEVENRALSTSVESILDQIAGSFYVPLWLAYGPLRNSYVVKRLLKYHRTGDLGFDFTVAILRRLTFGWKVVPGLIKAGRMLYARQYKAFYDKIESKLREWHNKNGLRSAGPSFKIDSTERNYNKEINKIILNAIGGVDSKICFDLYPESGYGLKLAEYTDAAVYLVTNNSDQADTFFVWREANRKPVLPILCNIWERNLHTSFALREGCDAVFLLPNVYETAAESKVPMDLVGRVLSILTKNTAVVGIGQLGNKTYFPTFVHPPETMRDPVEFARCVIGKYFRNQEVVQSSESSKTTLLILHK